MVLLPLFLYGRSGRRMSRFYMVMVSLENARKFYAQLLVVFLLLFHFVYVSGHPGEYGVLLSTVLSVLLCPFRRADRWLHRIHENRRTFRLWHSRHWLQRSFPICTRWRLPQGLFFWRPCFILPIRF